MFSRLGLTEAQARHASANVDVYRTSFRPMKHTISGRDERIMMKLLVDAQTDRVLGCHMVGPDAPEIIQVAAVAVKAGLTKAQWDATCAVHPTVAEELVTMREPVRPDQTSMG
jgi:glutathione reductase (NADPH)